MGTDQTAASVKFLSLGCSKDLHHQSEVSYPPSDIDGFSGHRGNVSCFSSYVVLPSCPLMTWSKHLHVVKLSALFTVGKAEQKGGMRHTMTVFHPGKL